MRGRDRERESRCVCPSLIVCIRVHSFGEEGEVERERERISVCLSLCLFVLVLTHSRNNGVYRERERESISVCSSLSVCTSVGSFKERGER